MNNKRATIAVLIIAIIGLSIGFAAFSNNLTVKSSANVNPTNNMNVVFSSSSSSAQTNDITPTKNTAAESANITTTDATIIESGRTLSNLSAAFTAPGQSVTYSLYVYNNGPYAAYLKDLVMGSKTCQAVETGDTTRATDALVSSACSGINMRVEIGNETLTASGSLNNQMLSANGGYVNATVTITYASGSAYVDGPMNVTFGDITFTATSNPNSIVDGGNQDTEVCETITNKSFGQSCTYSDLDSSGGITVGDKVTCGTEGFYVIETPASTTVKMLAEYNLNVTDPDADTYRGVSVSQAYACSTIGYQDEHVRGWVNEDDPNNLDYLKQITFYSSGSGSGSGSYIGSGSGSYYGSGSGSGSGTRTYYLPYGTVAFWSEPAKNNYNYNLNGYWTNNSYNSLNSNFSECTGANCYFYNEIQYPVEVYGKSNTNGATATLTPHVTSYVSALNSGVDGAEAQGRLITYDELVNLGCSGYNGSYSCSSAPAWVYQTSYWSGSAYHDDNVWDVGSSGYMGSSSFDINRDDGVRPVIEISSSVIQAS